jgi:hypothetical protein
MGGARVSGAWTGGPLVPDGGPLVPDGGPLVPDGGPLRARERPARPGGRTGLAQPSEGAQSDGTIRPEVCVRARANRSPASAQFTMFHHALT